MTTRLRLFVAVVALVVMTSACSGLNPAGPDPFTTPGGSDPPGGGTPLSASFKVYMGDCPGDPSNCASELASSDDQQNWVGFSCDVTYILPWIAQPYLASFTQRYTVWLFLGHPGKSGRTLTAQVLVGFPYPRITFKGDDPSRASPVRLSQVFNMNGTNGGVHYTTTGSVMAFEVADGDPRQSWVWNKKLCFRIPRA